MLKQKYKLSAALICAIFFLLALFSSAGFYPVRNLTDSFLCLMKVNNSCQRISNGVNWKNMRFSGNGILADEIPHIAGGYYYLNTNRYFINPEHPPLVKDIAGLGEFLARPKLPNITDQENLPADFHRAEYPFQNASFPKALEWQNNQDHFGTMYLFQPGNNPDKIAFFARLAVILANSLLLFLLFFLLTKIWTERAALIGLFFFAISQFSIAHSSFVVIDFMSAVLTGIAIVSFAIYLKKCAEGGKTAKYFSLTSFFFALALLSKFSSVVLLPAAFLGGLIFFIFTEMRSRAARDRISIILKYIFSYAAVVILALFLISVFYAFHTWKMENDVLVQKINENYPEEQLPAVGHKILEYMVYLNPLTKGLAEYANGTFMVVSRMVVSAQNTYFLGHVYGNEGAGLWYFPILYATKLSLGLHFFTLLVLALVTASPSKGWINSAKQSRIFRNSSRLLRRFTSRNDSSWLANPLSLLLWVFIACYMAVTLRSTFQIGLRHIMPVILAMCLLTGKGADVFWENILLKLSFSGGSRKLSFRLKHLFAIIAVLMIFSVFCSFPYYLEYYNILGGGTDSGYKIATDSNYDWGGSDVRRLGKWMGDNNVSEIYTQIFADVPLKYYLGDGPVSNASRSDAGRQKYFNLQDTGILPPSGSYLAVSVFEYMNNIYSWYIPSERKYTILENNLVARVGKTIFVYRIP